MYNILTSKTEPEIIWEAIKQSIKAVIRIYGRGGSKHKTVDYICECKNRQPGDEGDRVIIPRDFDTYNDVRWNAGGIALRIALSFLIGQLITTRK